MATIDPITGLPSSNVQKVYAGDKPISSAPAPVIDATKIGTTTVTPVPTAPAPKDFSSNVAQIANYTGSSAETATSQEEQRLQAEADAQKARAQSQMTDYAQAQSALGGKAGDLATAYGTKDETGQSVNTLAAQLRQLNAQAQAIQLDTLAKGQAEINKATGQNITQAAVARNTADVTRENLINMATIGIKSAIAKADYDTAKSYADQIVEAKYSGMEADLASKKTQLEWAMQQDLAPAQKKLADAQARQLEAKKKEVEDKKAQEKQVSDLVINASTQGAPSDLVAKAQQAKTPTEAAVILGEYAGDYLKLQSYKSQLLTDKAQRANIYSQIAERNKKAIESNQQASFVSPPLVNVSTGLVDPKSAVASVIKATGGKLKGGQAALDVLSSVQALANRNAKGVFEGVGFGGGAIPERFKSQAAISNRQDINAIGLKVQQWASGASLTKEQTEMVDKFTPQLNDSDNAVKTKINGLVNFMMQQVSSDLAGQGINYSPENIDMFRNIQTVDNKSLLNSIPSAPQDTTNVVDNKTFFSR